MNEWNKRIELAKRVILPLTGGDKVTAGRMFDSLDALKDSDSGIRKDRHPLENLAHARRDLQAGMDRHRAQQETANQSLVRHPNGRVWYCTHSQVRPWDPFLGNEWVIPLPSNIRPLTPDKAFYPNAIVQYKSGKQVVSGPVERIDGSMLYIILPSLDTFMCSFPQENLTLIEPAPETL